MTDDVRVSLGSATDHSDESRNSNREANGGTGTGSPRVEDDAGVPRDYVRWGIVVGLTIATGGAAMVVYFSQVPQALAALTLCVGFGIVLASFGSRAAGSYGGIAVVGAGALAIALFLVVEHYVPDLPLGPLIEARTTTCCRLTRSPVCCSGDRQANGFKGSVELLAQRGVMMIQGGGDFGWPATGTEDASQ